MARCLRPGAQSRKWRTSSGLATTGSLRGCLGRGNGLSQVPASFEGDLIEEAQGRDRDRDRTGRHLLAVGEEQLVVADLLGSQQRRRLAEVTGRTATLAGGRRTVYAEKNDALACPRSYVGEVVSWESSLARSNGMGCRQRVHGLATGADRQEKGAEDGWERGNLTTEGALPYRRISNAAKPFSPSASMSIVPHNPESSHSSWT